MDWCFVQSIYCLLWHCFDDGKGQGISLRTWASVWCMVMNILVRLVSQLMADCLYHTVTLQGLLAAVLCLVACEAPV